MGRLPSTHSISLTAIISRSITNTPRQRQNQQPFRDNERQDSKMASVMDQAKNTLAENFGHGADKLATHSFSLDQTPDLSGKVAVVTGGSQGIGYGVTHTLLSHNVSKLYILSTDEQVVEGAKEAIAKDMGEKIKSQEDRLDILVNNAGRGIMTYQLTDYGVDRHMAMSHMAHVILTSHLLPLMKETAEKKGTTVRITNQASNLHESVPKDLKFESLEDLNQDLGPNTQYGRSKLAAILYARYFNRKVTQNGHPNVLMNATHPGIVSTK